METQNHKLALCLAALSAAGPLSIDMYVPALPSMAESLAASAAVIQMSASTFFFGFTLGLLVHGPMSDRFGRKPIVYAALLLMFIASVGCTLSMTGGQFLGWRFLQGVGGAIGLVMAPAMVRDLYTGAPAARFIALIMMVTSLAPIVAPLVGSSLLHLGGWRMIFGLLAAVALFDLVMVYFVLPETMPVTRRKQLKLGNVLGAYGRLLRSSVFIPFAGALAFAQAAFFAYVTGSSFLMIDVYHLHPTTYSVIFACNSVGLLIGMQVPARLAARLGLIPIARAAAAIFAGAALVLFGLQNIGDGNLIGVCIAFFIAISAYGVLVPACSVMAMEAHGRMAGTAAALLGGLGFGAGAIAASVVSALNDGTGFPLTAVFLAGAFLSAVVAWLAFRNDVFAKISENGAEDA